MGLTEADLRQIRTIVREETRDVIKQEVWDIFQKECRAMVGDIFQLEGRAIIHDSVRIELSQLDSKVTAMENDIKEIYFILARLEKKH